MTYDVLNWTRDDGYTHHEGAARLAVRFDEADFAILMMPPPQGDDEHKRVTLVADDHNLIVSLLRRYANEQSALGSTLLPFNGLQEQEQKR